jgi:hypothetical protein
MGQRGYVGRMPRHFSGPASPEWRERHPGFYVIAVKLQLKRSEWPRRPDGSVDLEAFPERIFGPEHVVRHRDGSAEIVNVPEPELGEPPGTRTLHRATCETLASLDDDQYQMMGATPDELDQLLRVLEDVGTCQVCLG